MADRVRRDIRQQKLNRIWLLRSRAEVPLRIAEQVFEDDAEAGILELPFAAREEDRLVVVELLQPRPAVWVELRPIMRDVPVELLTGVGRAPDRLAERVLPFVAYEGGHVHTDLWVVRQTQASGGEPQHLRDPRATLQQDAQDDGFACWRVVGLPLVGAHRLRHTAATEMLRQGGGLLEIGQILRHRSLLTTAISAKVDSAALQGLARHWPGGAA